MATVDLSWTNPSVSMANIDSVCIYRDNVDDGATCATLNGYAVADNASYKVTEFTDMAALPTSYQHVDAGMTAGSYVYGIFAKNTVGVSPCLANDDSIVTVVVS